MDGMDLETILNGPAMMPPPGVNYNFEEPGGSHASGYVLVIVCAVFATLAVVVRIYTRMSLKRLTVADACMIAALGFFAGHCYIIYDLAISPGMFVHQWNLQMNRLPRFLYHVSLGSTFYALTCMMLKAGILLDWVGIFVPAGTRNFMFWASYGLIVFNCLFYLATIIIEYVQCSPREKIWNPLFQGGHCMRNNPFVRNLVAGGVAALTDLMILALPQKKIWTLNTTTKKKIGLSLLFAVGIIACASALARQYYFVRMLDSSDLLYLIAGTSVFSMTEMTAGFLILGIPSVPKTVKLISNTSSWLSSIRSRSSRKDPSANEPLSFLPWKGSANRHHERALESLDTDEYGLVSVHAERKGTSTSAHSTVSV